jgi:hypothetical protein
MMIMCVLASVSGGESPRHNDSLKDRSSMDESKLASTHTNGTNADTSPPPVFNLEDLIGRSFLMDQQEDGQRFRGCIAELIEDHESKLEDNPTRTKFRISVNEDKAEEIITYNKMLEYITKDEDSDIKWKFRRIISHEYKGSQCYVLVEWENGETNNEPLSTQCSVPYMHTGKRLVGQTRLETVQAYCQAQKEVHSYGKPNKAQIF